jgi:hypothetical protein
MEYPVLTGARSGSRARRRASCSVSARARAIFSAW